MAKGARDKIKLESTAGTGHFYTTTKNKRNMPEKMEDQEVRSRRPQACGVQGNQDQVKLGSCLSFLKTAKKPRLVRGFFIWCALSAAPRFSRLPASH